MKHIKFPEIGQYRNMITSIKQRCRYAGKDENGDPIYDPKVILPTVKFYGTVKLHGSCGGVSFDWDTGELWANSRKRVVTIGNDNHGFACFVHKNSESFITIIKKVRAQDRSDGSIVTLFGEWCGKGIQKGVAISQLEKMFVIFGVKYTKTVSENEDISWWSTQWGNTRDTDNRIFNITDFQTWEIDIDINSPEQSQNRLADITLGVEKECPVGRSFGVKGIGEGVVWSTYDGVNVERFKVKGEKHSGSKIKKLAKVDPEKVASVQEYVDYACTENRMLQGLGEVFGEDEPDIKKMGEFIGWVASDIIKEESDTLVINNLIWKDVASKVATKARIWLIKNYM
jgi:hypothetical protein